MLRRQPRTTHSQGGSSGGAARYASGVASGPVIRCHSCAPVAGVETPLISSQNANASSKTIRGIEVSQTTVPLIGHMLLTKKIGMTSSEPITPSHAMTAGMLRPLKKRYANSVLRRDRKQDSDASP